MVTVHLSVTDEELEEAIDRMPPRDQSRARTLLRDRNGCWNTMYSQPSFSWRDPNRPGVLLRTSHRKVLLRLEFGDVVSFKGRRFWNSCGNKKCVNPYHVRKSVYAD